jgi:hypothetical protein
MVQLEPLGPPVHQGQPVVLGPQEGTETRVHGGQTDNRVLWDRLDRLVSLELRVRASLERWVRLEKQATLVLMDH